MLLTVRLISHPQLSGCMERCELRNTKLFNSVHRNYHQKLSAPLQHAMYPCGMYRENLARKKPGLIVESIWVSMANRIHTSANENQTEIWFSVKVAA